MEKMSEVLFGHNNLFNRLQNESQQGILSPTLLLFGPTGIGKRSIAYFLAHHILDPYSHHFLHDKNFLAKPVSRTWMLMRQGAHPDFKNIDPRNSEQNIIGVDAVRALKGFFTTSCSLANHKVALIADCDRLNRAAANALLKLAEEPQEAKAHLILTTSCADHLPATLRSRCRLEVVQPLGIHDMEQWVQHNDNHFQESARFSQIGELCEGSPGEAVALKEQGYSDYETIVRWLTQSINSSSVYSPNLLTSIDSAIYRNLCRVLERYIIHIGQITKNFSENEQRLFLNLNAKATPKHWIGAFRQALAFYQKARTYNIDFPRTFAGISSILQTHPESNFKARNF